MTMSNTKVKKFLFALPFALIILFYGYDFQGKGRKSEPCFLKEKPLITVSAKGETVSFSEKDLGIPLIRRGHIVPGSVARHGKRIMFSISVSLPLYTVVHFYEQRLNRSGNRGRCEKGEQYLISYADKTGKRTNLTFQEGKDPTCTFIQGVHVTY